MVGDRYELRVGKYGTYFVDKHSPAADNALTNEEILSKLNDIARVLQAIRIATAGRTSLTV